MRALIRLLAARSGALVVPGNLAGKLGLPQTTVGRYLGLLEEVFLIKRIPAWSRHLSSRAVSTAKVAMVDSGIAVVEWEKNRAVPVSALWETRAQP